MNITPIEETWLKENLEKIDFLKKLEPLQVLRLIDQVTARNIGGGEAVIKQGQTGDTFFLLFNGAVTVWIERNGKRAKIAELKRGDYFGEISLLSGMPTSAEVMAKKPSRVFFLNSKQFINLVRENPELANFISAVMEKRLQERKIAAEAIAKGTPVELSLEIKRFLAG